MLIPSWRPILDLVRSLVVKTKRIYDPASKDDGLRILVSRFYPRGVRRDRLDRWMKELSPTKDLLYEYRKGEISWHEFSRRLVKELAGSEESTKAIRELHDYAKTRDLTLLCYEKEGENCHRNIVRDLIEHPFKLRRRRRKRKAD